MISKLLYLNFGKCGHNQHSLTKAVRYFGLT